LASLAGCASRSSALGETLSALWDGSASAPPAALDMRYRYMRIQVDGQPAAIFALAFIDNDAFGEIETWFSGNREVVKTQNGRIIGTAGLRVDWTRVTYPIAPPAWDKVQSVATKYKREHDTVPGYAFGVKDEVTVLALPQVPAHRLPETMPLDTAKSYKWFQEGSNTRSGVTLPTQLFALGLHRGGQTIVYSEQCLQPDFCMKLQRWPVLP
jgi:Group 4 capsule polysaccharide lipoprotein gfcB, YjbF